MEPWGALDVMFAQENSSTGEIKVSVWEEEMNHWSEGQVIPPNAHGFQIQIGWSTVSKAALRPKRIKNEQFATFTFQRMSSSLFKLKADSLHLVSQQHENHRTPAALCEPDNHSEVPVRIVFVYLTIVQHHLVLKHSGEDSVKISVIWTDSSPQAKSLNSGQLHWNELTSVSSAANNVVMWWQHFSRFTCTDLTLKVILNSDRKGSTELQD